MTIQPPTYPPPGPQSGLYPIPQRKPPARWLRWVLLAAVVLPSALSVLLTPVQVSSDKLLADLRAGQVQKVSLNCGEEGGDGPGLTIGTTVDVGARMTKNHVPRNASGGRTRHMTSVSASSANTTRPYGNAVVKAIGTVRP